MLRFPRIGPRSNIRPGLNRIGDGKLDARSDANIAHRMKTKAQTLIRTRRALIAAIAATALVAPAVRAQTAEEFRQLKTLVEQTQKTIEVRNNKPDHRTL